MYYKILKKNLTHNGFKYKLGLNEDTNVFKPVGYCRAGGLYYTDSDNIYKFLDYGELIAEVEPKGEIYMEDYGKIKAWKTDKLFIHSIVSIFDWFAKKSKKQQLDIIKRDGYAIGC